MKENIKLLMVIYIFMKRKQMDHMMNLGLLQMRKFILSKYLWKLSLNDVII